MERHEPVAKERPKKPEWKDYPWRYLVRSAEGRLSVFESDTQGCPLGPGSTARLIGTHETLKHAAARLGWDRRN